MAPYIATTSWHNHKFTIPNSDIFYECTPLEHLSAYSIENFKAIFNVPIIMITFDPDGKLNLG